MKKELKELMDKTIDNYLTESTLIEYALDDIWFRALLTDKLDINIRLDEKGIMEDFATWYNRLVSNDLFLPVFMDSTKFKYLMRDRAFVKFNELIDLMKESK